MNQLTAFGATLACEVPIVLWLGRHLPMGRLTLIAIGASTLTHPFAWRIASVLSTQEYRSGVLVIEAVVVLVEALWYRCWLPITIPMALRYSLAANACSFVVGLL